MQGLSGPGYLVQQRATRSRPDTEWQRHLVVVSVQGVNDIVNKGTNTNPTSTVPSWKNQKQPRPANPHAAGRQLANVADDQGEKQGAQEKTFFQSVWFTFPPELPLRCGLGREAPEAS